MTELLPCPFCGGQVKLWKAPVNELWQVACTNPRCTAISAQTSPERAVENWNHRAHPSPGDSLREAFVWGATWASAYEDRDGPDISKRAKAEAARRYPSAGAETRYVVEAGGKVSRLVPVESAPPARGPAEGDAK